ncbi:hypothetical protein AN214_01642 [Pseudoalteromonas sp. P1-9]|nr:hypothetical protein AN214_01642 [Pseudoalteromonas sp. P1-9]
MKVLFDIDKDITLKNWVCALTVTVLAGCGYFGAPVHEFDSTAKQLNLTNTVEGSWQRVCFITPYTDNQRAQKVLGFSFDVEKLTRIKNNDGVTLLVFIEDNQVEHYFETPRSNIDFTRLTPICIDREKAHFKLESNSNWTRAVFSGKGE